MRGATFIARATNPLKNRLALECVSHARRDYTAAGATMSSGRTH
jgi:hypothetical protein